MTPDKNDDAFLNKMTDRLKNVPGIRAVVLGGSRGRGSNGPDSDYDLGLYYLGDESLDCPALADAARDLDDESRADLISPPGDWGGWVNGGGWLTIDGKKVDVILRDLERVRQSVDDCHAGVVKPHYQTGHPHAFLNVMYAGELSIATILWDADGTLRALQAETKPYPYALKTGMYDYFGFEAGFSLMLAEAAIGKGDDYYVAAHVLRALSCTNQVLFAANNEYCINEKGAVRIIDGFSAKPERYGQRVKEILAHLGGDEEQVCRDLALLISDVRDQCLS